MLRVIVVIQARMGSTRLPGKVLKKIGSRSLVEWIRYRLSFAREIDRVVLATADNPENDALEDAARASGIEIFRGSESDLISRYLGVARMCGADAVVRVCADNPFVDPKIVDELVGVYKNNHGSVDFVCNNMPPTFPHGMDIEVIPTKTLERLDREVSDPLYREWLTMTIVENKDRFVVHNVEDAHGWRDNRLTVDYPEDLQLATEVFTRLHKEGEVFCMGDIVALLEKEPSLRAVNEKWLNPDIQDSVRKNSEFQLLKKQNNEKRS